VTDDTNGNDDDPQFDPHAIRDRFRATARDFIEKDGYQAYVEEHDSDGVPTEAWEGMHCHPKEDEAIAAGQAWINAKVAQLGKVDELRRRRRRAIGPKLAKSMGELDVLEADRKTIAAAIKSTKDNHRTWIREAESPSVEIEFSERTSTFTLTVLEGGKSYDSRQQSLPGVDDEAEPVDGDGPIDETPESHGMDPNAVEWDGDGDKPEGDQ